MKYGLQIGLKFNQDGSPKKVSGQYGDCGCESGQPGLSGDPRPARDSGGRGIGPMLHFPPGGQLSCDHYPGAERLCTGCGFLACRPAGRSAYGTGGRLFCQPGGAVEVPEGIHMRFSHVRIDDHDVRICLEPWDPQEETRLRRYRDEVASRLGLWLPGHDTYTYHITLAYMRTIPEGDCCREQERRVSRMDACLKNQDGFFLSSPRIAFMTTCCGLNRSGFPGSDKRRLQQWERNL